MFPLPVPNNHFPLHSSKVPSFFPEISSRLKMANVKKTIPSTLVSRFHSVIESFSLFKAFEIKDWFPMVLRKSK